MIIHADCALSSQLFDKPLCLIDLALRRLVTTLPISAVCSAPKKTRSDAPSPSTISSLKGIVFALCCHHKCRWSQYVAHDVWYQLGFNENDFHLMTLMSSWATCGVRVGGTTGEPKGSGVLWSASAGVYWYVCMYVCMYVRYVYVDT